MGLFCLLIFGLGYRYLAFEIFQMTREPMRLPVPLSQFPGRIADWEGSEVPLSETVQAIAGNDDYLSRQYRNLQTNQAVNLYIAFTGQPRAMKGHEPQNCYRGAGWYSEGIEESQIKSDSGRSIRCLIHRFSRMIPSEESIVVLQFYVVNGRITVGEKFFTGLNWRSPFSFGSARYVAQIQLSSSMENAVLAAGRLFADKILAFFPDTGGAGKTSDGDRVGD
jgi:EpsI family protein